MSSSSTWPEVSDPVVSATPALPVATVGGASGTRSPVLFSLVQLFARTPSRLLLTSWGAALVATAYGPLDYFETIRPATWLFLGACLASFAIGSSLAVWPTTPVRPPALSPRYLTHVRRVMKACVVVGVLGAIAITVERIFFSGIDFSDGFVAARMARAEEINAGDADELRRTPLLYLGYLTFPFAVPAYLIYLLEGDRMRWKEAVWAHTGLVAPVTYAVLYGGRSPIGLVIGFAVAAIIVRILCGQRALPLPTVSRVLLASFVIGAVLYSGYVFAQRRELQGGVAFPALEERFETVYMTSIDPRIGDLVEQDVVPAETAMNLLMTYFYFTHEMTMLDRTIHAEKFGPFYGQYQFYLPAILIWRLFPGVSLEREMMSQAQAADVYGWFSTAWGGMYVDFGVGGALVQAVICGWLCGMAYRRVRRQGSVSAKVCLAYAITGIVASPILSIFTISVSLLMFVAILVAAYFVQTPRLRLLTALPSTQ